jgi:FkbM family methyltransferase
MGLFGLLRFILGHPLNRGGRVAALGRFARWQAASRIIRRPIALPFAGGARLLVSRGMTGATGNYYCGLHEVSEMAFVLHALREGDLFVDVGANIGSYTILAAGAAGAEAISVEPVPSTFDRLLDNIRLNRLEQRVQAECCGLSSEPGELRFLSSLDTMNRVALPGDDLPTVTVPVDTLDALCKGRPPAVIKIDVEGHEKSVLQGGAAVLAQPGLKAVLMETNQSGAKFGVADSEIVELMCGHGFQPATYDPFARRLSPLQGAPLNTIFVRDIDAMSRHCAAARRYSLINGSI